jgi:hypothetical protein
MLKKEQFKFDKITKKIYNCLYSIRKEIFLKNEKKTHCTCNEGDRKIKKIPESFLCKITFEIMREPYITKSGITYERESLIEHFKKNGEFEPITRVECKEMDLIPNINLRDAIDEFLIEFPDSYENSYE